MEVIKRNNPFFSPVSRSEGVDYSDDLVIEYQYVDFAEMGPSGEKSDFVIEKKEVEVNRYHLNKVIQERCKGCSLAEIIARCDQSGDYSILNSREVSYGDGTEIPQTLSDACDKAARGASLLESVSKDDLELGAKLSKMSSEEFNAYIKDLVDKKYGSPQAENVENKEVVNDGK